MVTGELVKVIVPVLVKFPPKVRALPPEVNVPALVKLPPIFSDAVRVRADPELIINGMPQLSTFAAFIVIVELFVFAMITPPLPAKGVVHSVPILRLSVVLYCKV